MIWSWISIMIKFWERINIFLPKILGMGKKLGRNLLRLKIKPWRLMMPLICYQKC
jgi:hypothetical protein